MEHASVLRGKHIFKGEYLVLKLTRPPSLGSRYKRMYSNVEIPNQEKRKNLEELFGFPQGAKIRPPSHNLYSEPRYKGLCN